jgi:hypothetical protein
MLRFYRLDKNIFKVKTKLGIIEAIGFLKYVRGDIGASSRDVLLYKKITTIDEHEFIQAENSRTFRSKPLDPHYRVLIQGERVDEIAVWNNKVFLYAESDGSIIKKYPHKDHMMGMHANPEYLNLVQSYIEDGWEIVDQPNYDYDNAESYCVIKTNKETVL